MNHQIQAKKMNTMAILGFIFTFIFVPIGFILSLIGFVQLSKDSAQSGKGLAIAGLVISLLLIVVGAFLLAMYQLRVDFDAAQDAYL